MGSIVYVGGPRPVELRVRKGVEIWRPSEVAARPLSRKRLVVLLSSALRELDPPTSAERLRALSDRVAICFSDEGGATARALLRWHRAGFPIRAAEDLDELASAIFGRLQRPVLATGVWLPIEPRPGTEAERIAATIPRLDVLSVERLARALGLGERKLLRVCRRSFHWTTKMLLQSYLIAAEAALAPELRADERAEVLGYFDASTLERAVRDAKSALRHSRVLADSA